MIATNTVPRHVQLSLEGENEDTQVTPQAEALSHKQTIIIPYTSQQNERKEDQVSYYNL